MFYLEKQKNLNFHIPSVPPVKLYNIKIIHVTDKL